MPVWDAAWRNFPLCVRLRYTTENPEDRLPKFRHEEAIVSNLQSCTLGLPRSTFRPCGVTSLGRKTRPKIGSGQRISDLANQDAIRVARSGRKALGPLQSEDPSHWVASHRQQKAEPYSQNDSSNSYSFVNVRFISTQDITTTTSSPESDSP